MGLFSCGAVQARLHERFCRRFSPMKQRYGNYHGLQQRRTYSKKTTSHGFQDRKSDRKQLPQTLREKGTEPRATATTACLFHQAALLPQTLRVLLAMSAYPYNVTVVLWPNFPTSNHRFTVVSDDGKRPFPYPYILVLEAYARKVSL